jgi:U3-containing 90S pre-ribosomal complex subunit
MIPSDAAIALWNLYTTFVKSLSDQEIIRPLVASHFAVPHVLQSTSTTDIKTKTEEKSSRPMPFVAPAIDPDLDDLPSRIKELLFFAGGWRANLNWKGPKSIPPPSASPVLLIITYSAVRAAAMLKPLSTFGVRIAKLFGKHLAIADQIAILNGPPVTIAVGTPHRINALLNAKALKLDRLCLIVIDTRKDIKGFTLLDHPNKKLQNVNLVFIKYTLYIKNIN